MLRNQPRGMPRISFSQALKTGVERQDQTRGWCPSCKRYQQLHTRKQIQTMPSVLMINAAIHTPEAKQIWATPNWLPQEIGVIVEQGQFFCYQDQDLALHVQRGVYNVQVYELIGVVADVKSSENQKPHLVSLVNGKQPSHPLLKSLSNSSQYLPPRQICKHQINGIYSTTFWFIQPRRKTRCDLIRVGSYPRFWLISSNLPAILLTTAGQIIWIRHYCIVVYPLGKNFRGQIKTSR